MIVYLATPYTHSDPKIRECRFNAVTKAAVYLTNKGLNVYSPITQSHLMAKVGKLPTSWDYWKGSCEDFLSASNTLFILKLRGWKESIGVQGEIEIANAMDIPIVELDPKILKE